MLPPLETDRLRLSPCRPGDVDALLALWRDPLVRRNLWDDVLISREQAAEVVRASLEVAQSRGLGIWLLAEHHDPAALAGFCVLRAIDEGPEVELLYALAPAAWGRGLATEAARAVMVYGWDALRLPRIWALTDPPNVASQKVMQRLGMRPAPSPSSAATVAYVADRPIGTEWQGPSDLAR